MEINELKEQYQGDIKAFFNKFEWQLWLTGGKELSSLGELDKLVGALRGWLAKRSGMQVSSIGVFNRYPYPHVHAFLLGTNRHGKSLNDVSDELLHDAECFWKMLTGVGGKPGNKGKLDRIYDQIGCVGYTVECNLMDYSHVLTPRGLKLLNKLSKATH